MIERTLILLKPDCVQRGICGEIVSRFEKVGLKVVGLKMVWIDKDFGKKHYFDLGERRGEEILDINVNFISEGPVIAICLQGINAPEQVRKMVGATEPKTANPGTIRGDYSHHSYDYTNNKKIAVRNLIHASANKEEAENEIKLWFSVEELHDYTTVHEKHVF